MTPEEIAAAAAKEIAGLHPPVGIMKFTDAAGQESAMGSWSARQAPAWQERIRSIILRILTPDSPTPCQGAGCSEITEHHDCDAQLCPTNLRGLHHYWYVHHGAHPVASCGPCEAAPPRKPPGQLPHKCGDHRSPEPVLRNGARAPRVVIPPPGVIHAPLSGYPEETICGGFADSDTIAGAVSSRRVTCPVCENIRAVKRGKST